MSEQNKDRYDENQATASVTKTWGVIGAAVGLVSGASALLSTIFDWDKQLVAGVIGISILVIFFVGIMIDRQARVQIKHDSLQDKEVDQIKKELSDMNKMILVIRKDLLRIQLNQMLLHDDTDSQTILKIANTYFVSLGGDWYMTSRFIDWANRHKVTIPPQIEHCLHNNETDH